MIDERLLALLACPACGGDVRLDGQHVVCIKCQRRYPIKDGVPVLLVEESTQ